MRAAAERVERGGLAGGAWVETVATPVSANLGPRLLQLEARLAVALAAELTEQGLMPYVYSYGYYEDRPLLRVTYFSDISRRDLERLPRQFAGLPVEVAPAARARLEQSPASEARFYPIEQAFSEAFRRAVAAGYERERALERAIGAARTLLP